MWITGLSGAGKTTLAKALDRLLRCRGFQPVLLDGDEVRDVIRDSSTGYDRGGRLENAWRICRMARLLAAQGHTILVSTVSLFKEIHAWNRENLPGYFEIYLNAPIELLRRRDAKGLYARVDRGEISGVPGVDMEFDAPMHPDLQCVISPDSPSSEVLAENCLDQINVKTDNSWQGKR